jgi:hypothetical protein
LSSLTIDGNNLANLTGYRQTVRLQASMQAALPIGVGTKAHPARHTGHLAIFTIFLAFRQSFLINNGSTPVLQKSFTPISRLTDMH